MQSYSLLLLAIRSDLAPQVAVPPGDAHVRHLDVSSFLGPASMVERWVGSTTRRRGAIGGEFLQQGFAYKQSGGREEGSRAARVGGEGVRDGGRGRTSPLYIEGGAASPCPSSKPISSLNNLNSPLSRNPISSLNQFKLSLI